MNIVARLRVQEADCSSEKSVPVCLCAAGLKAEYERRHEENRTGGWMPDINTKMDNMNCACFLLSRDIIASRVRYTRATETTLWLGTL